MQTSKYLIERVPRREAGPGPTCYIGKHDSTETYPKKGSSSGSPSEPTSSLKNPKIQEDSLLS